MDTFLLSEVNRFLTNNYNLMCDYIHEIPPIMIVTAQCHIIEKNSCKIMIVGKKAGTRSGLSVIFFYDYFFLDTFMYVWEYRPPGIYN